MESEQQSQRQNTIDGHQRLKQLSEAIEPYISAISNVLMANMAEMALRSHEEPAITAMHSSSNPLPIRGITVRVATRKVAKSAGRSQGAMPSIQFSQNECEVLIHVREICGEGLDDYIYCE